jgi:hypothetical protein
VNFHGTRQSSCHVASVRQSLLMPIGQARYRQVASVRVEDPWAKRNLIRVRVRQPYQLKLRWGLSMLKEIVEMQTKINQVSMIECPCSMMPQLRLDSNWSPEIMPSFRRTISKRCWAIAALIRKGVPDQPLVETSVGTIGIMLGCGTRSLAPRIHVN